ncbi:hepatitis A virus cellular receptor 1-like isoform X5 [Acanthopagrus latus]|uniref:hepatitis A virus cellular receptor 1-like isoform X5 n=1 Tax=Acanthopagrus latus TaxID=8177 RepID=UPI00187CB41F|nr:hepatitis A virus cellular receptor 1-like isoform X5 [Acanthopagrus latus]
MTSWKCKARLFLLVLLSTIDLSYGNCMEYFNVDKWTGNITQVITLVEPEDHQDTVECSLERAARENKTSARSYESILYDCFRIVSKQGKPVNLYTEKCKGNTSGTMPFYQFMCLTLAAIKHKYPDVEIEAEQCEYDTTCKFLSGGPSTGLNQSTTLPLAQPERTTSAVAPKVTQPSSSPPTTATTTTELPPTTINFTHITGLNQSTTLPLAQPERTTSAVPPKVTQPSSSPPTTATTTTELPPTTINFTHITAQPERTTSAVPPKVTQPSSSPPTTATTTTELPQITINSTQSNAEKTFSNEKENLALKIFSVISASLNVAALMVFLYQRGSNPRLSHESVATYVTDRASLEAQLVTELKPTELDPISSYSPLTPNGFHVGNEE